MEKDTAHSKLPTASETEDSADQRQATATALEELREAKKENKRLRRTFFRRNYETLKEEKNEEESLTPGADNTTGVKEEDRISVSSPYHPSALAISKAEHEQELARKRQEKASSFYENLPNRVRELPEENPNSGDSPLTSHFENTYTPPQNYAADAAATLVENEQGQYYEPSKTADQTQATSTALEELREAKEENRRRRRSFFRRNREALKAYHPSKDEENEEVTLISKADNTAVKEDDRISVSSPRHSSALAINEAERVHELARKRQEKAKSFYENLPDTVRELPEEHSRPKDSPLTAHFENTYTPPQNYAADAARIPFEGTAAIDEGIARLETLEDEQELSMKRQDKSINFYTQMPDSGRLVDPDKHVSEQTAVKMGDRVSYSKTCNSQSYTPDSRAPEGRYHAHATPSASLLKDRRSNESSVVKPPHESPKKDRFSLFRRNPSARSSRIEPRASLSSLQYGTLGSGTNFETPAENLRKDRLSRRISSRLKYIPRRTSLSVGRQPDYNASPKKPLQKIHESLRRKSGKYEKMGKPETEEGSRPKSEDKGGSEDTEAASSPDQENLSPKSENKSFDEEGNYPPVATGDITATDDKIQWPEARPSVAQSSPIEAVVGSTWPENDDRAASANPTATAQEIGPVTTPAKLALGRKTSFLYDLAMGKTQDEDQPSEQLVEVPATVYHQPDDLTFVEDEVSGARSSTGCIPRHRKKRGKKSKQRDPYLPKIQEGYEY